jgi:hypothetical protein
MLRSLRDGGPSRTRRFRKSRQWPEFVERVLLSVFGDTSTGFNAPAMFPSNSHVTRRLLPSTGSLGMVPRVHRYALGPAGARKQGHRNRALSTRFGTLGRNLEIVRIWNGENRERAMPLPSLRFTIGRLMVAVAVIAVLLVWLGLWAAIALVGLGLPVIIPATIASPGHRVKVASWASSLQPAVVLFYLYATWATAWCVLGHRPRSSLDDPKSISPIVDAPYIMFAFSLMLGWMICAGSGLLLSAVCLARQRDLRPLLALPFAWLAGYLVLLWDPLGVLYWYFD